MEKSSNYSEDIDLCLEDLKKHDRQSYYLSLFLPEPLCEDFIILMALEVELAKIPHHANEAALIQMRYQWWFDELDQLDGNNTPQHPLLRALKAHSLHIDPEIYLRAKSKESEFSPFQTDQDWHDYFLNTHQYLWTLFCNKHNLTHHVENLYKGLKILKEIKVWLSLSHQQAKGRLLISNETLQRAGVSVQDVFSHSKDAHGRMQTLLEQQVKEWEGQLSSLSKEMPHPTCKLILPMIRQLIKEIKKQNYQLEALPKITYSPLFIWRLLIYWLGRRFL